ncbi:hypothetical protein PBRA_006924 [Plasmodiophora brassicae]|uniref:RanBP-type and C3HC4-type zinc finger-containing protein 1 n=1 Tax=Plasmodiophora brassicae TaxID=37360 RepID=A0A0G4IU59_PLABS|nr:hypothetical protein PBRA_006924 [Plasmodiophora brassicae]
MAPWTCNLCTYENEDGSTSCEICLADRVVEADEEANGKQEATTWSCMVCGSTHPIGQTDCNSFLYGKAPERRPVRLDLTRIPKRARHDDSDESSNSSENDDDDDDDAEAMEDDAGDGNDDVIFCRIEEVHHAFTAYENTVELKPARQPLGLLFQLYPHQKLGLDFLEKSEKFPKYRGSILADDMGLGKTVQSIALICSRPATQEELETYVRATLVVCPVSLADQWKSELDRVAPRLRTVIFHGPKRDGILNRAVGMYDVVITTYNIVALDARTPDKSVLMTTKWLRVILDEAHLIKNGSSKWSRACCELNAKYRLCLTGTPVQNSMQDLGSLLKFLRIRPYNRRGVFSKIEKRLRAMQKKGNDTGAAKAWAPIGLLLRSLMLRRRKHEVLHELPPRTVTTVVEEFSLEELEVYKAVEEQSVLKFNKYLRDGTVIRNSANILVMIMRLRQCCDHPSLLPTEKGDDRVPDSERQREVKLSQPILRRLGEIEEGQFGVQECGICLDVATPPVVASCCGKISCADCFRQSLEATHCCAYCRASQEDVLIATLHSAAEALGRLAELEAGLPADVQKMLRDVAVILESTKINKLISILEATRKTDPKEKTIVFSQFTSFLDLIEPKLAERGFTFVRYDGTLNRQEKGLVISEFHKDDSVTVLLASLKCASLGLNLTCARRVVLLDIWWNPAVEEQAFDRCHRLGQTREVIITRITIANTIEQRIIELQESKRMIARAALSEGEFKLPPAMRLSVEDFKLLFRSSFF